VPTQEALALIVEVDRCFAGFEMIEHRIRSLRSFGLGRLAIASSRTGQWFHAARHRRLRPGRAACADVVPDHGSREVYQQVSAGQLDFGLMADELSVSGLEHSQFMSVPGVMVMNDRHPLAGKPLITADDLLEHPFIALNPEDASRRRLEQELILRGRSCAPSWKRLIPIRSAIRHARVGMGMAHPILALDYASRGPAPEADGSDGHFTRCWCSGLACRCRRMPRSCCG
jgi:hypothetical protein